MSTFDRPVIHIPADAFRCSHLPGRCMKCDRQACLRCRVQILPESDWEKTTAVIGDCTSCAPEVCQGCHHPVSHHRTGKRNEHNASQSRCAYRANPSDPECPCQLHRAAALSEAP